MSATAVFELNSEWKPDQIFAEMLGIWKRAKHYREVAVCVNKIGGVQFSSTSPNGESPTHLHVPFSPKEPKSKDLFVELSWYFGTEEDRADLQLAVNALTKLAIGPIWYYRDFEAFSDFYSNRSGGVDSLHVKAAEILRFPPALATRDKLVVEA
jgi:hypothetical protein